MGKDFKNRVKHNITFMHSQRFTVGYPPRPGILWESRRRIWMEAEQAPYASHMDKTIVFWSSMIANLVELSPNIRGTAVRCEVVPQECSFHCRATYFWVPHYSIPRYHAPSQSGSVFHCPIRTMASEMWLVKTLFQIRLSMVSPSLYSPSPSATDSPKVYPLSLRDDSPVNDCSVTIKSAGQGHDSDARRVNFRVDSSLPDGRDCRRSRVRTLLNIQSLFIVVSHKAIS